MSELEMNTFWMVLADNSRKTTKRYASFELAQNEARRLAALYKGVKFFVLKCEGACVVTDPAQWIYATTDDVQY